MESVEKLITNIKISPQVERHLYETERDLAEYLYSLLNADKIFREKFLNTLKMGEILNTNIFEGENQINTLFMINEQKKGTFCVDELTKSLKDKNAVLTNEKIKSIHFEILKGTSSINRQPGEYRDHQVWIGEPGSTPENGAIFVPPRENEIPRLMNEFLDYFNRPTSGDLTDHPLIKPAIIHFLMGYIHPFCDGNGRMARLLHHGKMWQLCNYEYNADMQLPLLECPALYLSANISQYRTDYLKALDAISKDPSAENWNKWFEFNLTRIDEQLYYLRKNLNDTYYNYNKWNEISKHK